MNAVLRPMSTAEILDTTFRLYRKHFVLFAGIAVLPAALALILHVTGVATRLTVYTPGRSAGETQFTSLAFELLVFFIASVIGGGIATGATVYAVYCLHLGKPATIAGSYKNVLASWLRVIVAAVLVFLTILAISGVAFIALIFGVFWPMSRMTLSSPRAGIIAGFVVLGLILVLIIFWLYLSAWLCFVIPALLLDKSSIFKSFRRSHFLSKGSRGRLLLMFLLTLVLTLAFTWTLRLPGSMLFDEGRQQIPLRLWSDASQFLSAVVAGPVATIAIALFYIDQRIRKEAFDLHLMMQAIQEDAGAGPTVG